eukprot:CAMPEP_0170076116 /NCGR_PEP_ID=MMETSP0019_2-20121128/13145_1 /TAXON_ID=98059 /ORGANISM="Dinobryon sp., Strain UTEXLB2267" /LENGTH=203 /DNA_ID=CAMNT_0010287547 /DNA_START=487 /DNA_END=1098 /DNA_ORIENTATION=+
MALAHSLSCGDSFCFICISDWSLAHSTCPICQSSFDIKLAIPNKTVTSAIRDILAKDKESATEWEARVDENLNRKKASAAAAIAIPVNNLPPPITAVTIPVNNPPLTAVVANRRESRVAVTVHRMENPTPPTNKRPRRGGGQTKINFNGCPEVSHAFNIVNTNSSSHNNVAGVDLTIESPGNLWPPLHRFHYPQFLSTTHPQI